MPALPKEKLIKRVQTPARVHPKSLTNNDVKRLGPTRRTSSKRTLTQSSQTQTALACLILTERCKYADEGTQTTDDIGAYDLSSSNGFATRLGKFLGGSIFSFMKYFKTMP